MYERGASGILCLHTADFDSKGITFYMWLKYMGEKYRYETPGLRREVNRRRILLSTFSNWLDDGMPADIVSGDLRTTFGRWLEYTQSKIARRKLVDLFAKRRCIRRMQNAFYGIKYSLRLSHTFWRRNRHVPHGILSASADVEKMEDADIGASEEKLQQLASAKECMGTKAIADAYSAERYP